MVVVVAVQEEEEVGEEEMLRAGTRMGYCKKGWGHAVERGWPKPMLPVQIGTEKARDTHTHTHTTQTQEPSITHRSARQ